MTTSASEASPLLAFSNTLAELVAQSGQFIVTVNGRRRRPSSGVHWRSGLIVTVDHALTREDSITITLADDKTVSVTIAGRLIRGGALMTVEIIVSEKPGREA